MLEGFEPINLIIGLPSMSVTTNGVSFSKSAIIKLGKPEYVILMINRQNKQIAVQVCDEKEENATPFLKNKSSNSSLIVRWNNKDLLNNIEKIMDWNLDESGYKINGDYIIEEQAIIFDLNKANKIT